MRSLIVLLAILAALTIPLRGATGQEQPTSIPVDLALALMGGSPDAYGSRAPVIVVGRAPEGMPPSLSSLQFATVLGGIADSRGTLVVLKSTQPPNEVLVSFDKLLTASGWGPPPPPPDADRGGFVATPYAGTFGNLYCGDSGTVTVSYSPTAQGGTYVKVRYSREREPSFCVPIRTRVMLLPALKFPVLRPPPGMVQRGGGGGRGGDNVSTSAQLIGPLHASEVIPPYLEQLRAAGWKTGTVASSGDVSVASVETTDPEGKLWRGALIARRVSETRLEVSIEMTRAAGS
jgi:hypothetical protein